jgi:quercetin dioxygenase-like cupin family protein
MDERHSRIIRAQELDAHDRGGGVRTQYLVTRETGTHQFLSGITEFDAGAELPFHSHNCDESVVVLEGDATFDTDDESVRLGAGDTTFVPEGVLHRFRNVGDGRTRILWIYGSVDATRTLAETGETVAIGSAAEHRS